MKKAASIKHRIGAVSSLSGVPVPTLRIWEMRYAAFKPEKTGGSHRLYDDEDVLRASLLRQLTSCGHAISTVATLAASELSALLNQQRLSDGRRVASEKSQRSVSVVVVGMALAARFQAAPLMTSVTGVDFQVTDTLVDLDSAADQPLKARPDLLLVRANTLHLAAHASIRQLVAQHCIPQVIVLYSYGQERVIEAMKMGGMIVRREPISDSDFVELIKASLLLDARQANDFLQKGVMIPPRKYSDQTLTKVAGISTNVLCECPKHVAELIAQLAHFEQYSQECLNNSQEDAHLHAQLSAVSGTARAMFERALEMVAEHEGIPL
jgi:DNA-binding transcriptional MerR regulator